MSPRLLRRTASASLAVVTALALAACSGDAAPAVSAASAPAVASEPSPSTTTAEPSPAAEGGPACLVGTWTMDEAALQDYYGQISGLSDGELAFTPVGQATLTMRADGTYSWMPDATISTSTSGIDIEVALGGSLEGSYTAAAGTITTSTDAGDGLTVRATVGGMEVDPDAVAEQILSAPLTDTDYACTADSLQLSSVIAEQTVTMTLTR